MKIPFLIKEDQGYRSIEINGEIFDWGIDEDALNQANQFASNPETLKAIHNDIKSYFIECLEQYIGFKPTIKQVNEALKNGYIEND